MGILVRVISENRVEVKIGIEFLEEKGITLRDLAIGDGVLRALISSIADIIKLKEGVDFTERTCKQCVAVEVGIDDKDVTLVYEKLDDRGELKNMSDKQLTATEMLSDVIETMLDGGGKTADERGEIVDVLIDILESLSDTGVRDNESKQFDTPVLKTSLDIESEQKGGTIIPKGELTNGLYLFKVSSIEKLCEVCRHLKEIISMCGLGDKIDSVVYKTENSYDLVLSTLHCDLDLGKMDVLFSEFMLDYTIIDNWTVVLAHYKENHMTVIKNKAIDILADL